MKKILFCGTMVPEKIEYQVKDISAAGNRFQNNMIRNLESMEYEVLPCSFLGMDIPINIKEMLVGHYAYKDGGLLKGIWDYHNLLKRIISDTEIVVCYNIIYAWLALPLIARKKRKRSIAIVADYSESISYKSVAGKLYAMLQLWSMRRFDTIVGLSGNIKNKLRKTQRFILMEGGIDDELYRAFSCKPHAEGAPITFMYSGLLSHVTGVNLLLEVMRQIKRQDIRLLISGKGELEEAAIGLEKEDDRVCYLGHLPYEEYVQKLQEADVLLNPRDMRLPENQNNFPSKIMDYLASGKLIVSTKFVGWERFEENILFCDCHEQAIKDCMEHAIEKLAEGEAAYRRNREKAKQYEWKEQLKRVLE